ncbi:MAG: hypothetical protein COW00_18795 [Bdellovibrio sp. CG12_big_fil_rev_8_21_14_0_65_39_13]|nr:MAG: hypothetical protein COW78_05865 [Bdellovibrio sp. CG22_combo_CG10-13_8_21_14_all_39_27]PIQ57748.1 MAG: hypothetical protein COW00_18795 [Bdellovibrio sp. CG12_big_fil_rev_8_21_14_0_65_39_13]PIR34978.1 MAG: hypothetical protein COV37_10890 [Bdellovibrio sp. CG11_big_fil_rev_8_21_14_0_20_39_38]PJB53023.1 MAG: hypothetical protein CO099_09465 [Bdellovibrio sp. CG_4_9_14_3_um_filter_39_7]
MKSVYDSIVVEVGIDKDSIHNLEFLKDSPVLNNAKKVTFLHVYNEKSDIHLPLDMKDRANKAEVEKIVKAKLNDLKKVLSPEKSMDNWFTQVIYHSDAKLETLQFLKQVSADLVVVATRGKHGASGLFRDSFSSYLVEYSPCDVYVIRPIH